MATAAALFVRDPKFLECKTKLSKTVNSELLDYKHKHPSNLLDTIDLLRKIIGNVLEHPDEEKYRKVRASNTKFAQSIAPHLPAVKFLTLAGWHSTVDRLEKYWVCEAKPGTFNYSVLEEAKRILDKALTEVQAKSDQARRLSDKKALDEKERERIRNAMREDDLRRAEKQEQQALALAELSRARLAKEETDRQELATRKQLEEERELREKLAAVHGAPAAGDAAPEDNAGDVKMDDALP